MSLFVTSALPKDSLVFTLYAIYTQQYIFLTNQKNGADRRMLLLVVMESIVNVWMGLAHKHDKCCLHYI